MKRTRLALIVLLSLLLALPLLGCGGASLPEWANEEELTAGAQEVIDLVNVRQFDEVADMFSTGTLTSDALEASLSDLLDSLGGFKDYGAYRCDAVTENGTEFVRVFQVSNYENQSVTFTVVFDEAGALSGLWI